MNEFDTMCMSDIICPYCGHKIKDTSELNEHRETETQCDKCYKEFDIFIDWTPNYSTYKKEDKGDDGTGND